MRLATLRLPDGLTRAAVSAAADVDGTDRTWALCDAVDLDALVRTTDVHRIADEALRFGPRIDADEVTLVRPLHRPRKVVCCGLNYADHIAETGRETPRYPTLFAKFADTLTDPRADLVVDGAHDLDWEAELVVVVGRPVRRADREEAAAAILGYTVANDVSMRDWQARTLQWFQGKAWDATTPIGPVIVTADAFDPAEGARIRAQIDGEVVQDSTLDQLVFDAADLVAYVSQFTRLDPGDLLLTGTPGGVGLGRTPTRYLRDGETLVTSIAGIGELRNRVRLDAREDAR